MDNTGIWVSVEKNCALPKRVNHATAVDENTGKCYILGGFHQFDDYACYKALSTIDCHVFDGNTLQAETLVPFEELDEELQRSQFTDKPLMRYGVLGCFLNGKIYIYGGVCDFDAYTNPCWSNYYHVYELDVQTRKFKNLTKDVLQLERGNNNESNEPQHFNIFIQMTRQINKCPGIRDGHSMVACKALNGFFIFGGWRHIPIDDFANDVWFFSLTNNTWIQVHVKGSILEQTANGTSFEFPHPRDFSTIQIVEDSLVLYGGRWYTENDFQFNAQASSVYDPNVWVIPDLIKVMKGLHDIQLISKPNENVRWKKISKKGSKKWIPTPRRSHMSFVRNNEYYITGGVDSKEQHHGDIWKFNLKTEKWTKIAIYKSTKGKQPFSRRRGSCLYLPRKDRMIMMCGTRYPQTKHEIENLDNKRKTGLIADHNISKTSKEILIEVNDYSVLDFEVNLKKIIFQQMSRSIDQENKNAEVNDFYNINSPLRLSRSRRSFQSKFSPQLIESTTLISLAEELENLVIK